jgi:hypothetical protein
MSCIYTKEELITFIKAIDLKLSSNQVESSRLDSGQGISQFSVDIAELSKQKDYYYRLLQQFYPDDYSGILKLC